MLKSTFSGLQLCFHLHSFSHCCLQNLKNNAQNSPKIQTSSIVIDLGTNWKCICNFLLVININFGHSWFPPAYPCLKQPSGETPFDVKVICTLLKCTFRGLQFHHRQYGYLHSC